MEDNATQDKAADAGKDKAADAGKGKAKPRKMVTITIHSHNGEVGDVHMLDPVTGVHLTIKRDIEVSVPVEVVNILNDAVIDAPKMEGSKVVGWVKQKRFPFSVNG